MSLPSSSSSDIISPTTRHRRTLAYWHAFQKLPHTQTGYNIHTARVEIGCPERARIQLAQQCTGAPAHPCTATPVQSCTTHTGDVATVNKENIQGQAREIFSDEDLGHTPYFLRGIVQSEQADRESMGITPADYGTRWQSAYRGEIGPTPVCAPADHAKAYAYLGKLKAVLGKDTWTPAERTRLRLMVKKWQIRAEGYDARFEVVGNMIGSPSPEQRKEIRDMRVMIAIRKEAGI